MGIHSPLQMMPGGMMPWDWGSMWFAMFLPVAVIVAGVLAVVFLLIRNQRPPSPVPATSPSQLGIGPLPSPKSGVQENSGSGIDAVGKVVLSLAPTLTIDERRVMDELAKAGGEMLQSSLPEMTGYTKATVSKAVHGLETRGIIVRERHKWTYWCKVNPRLIERTQSVPS